MMKKEPYHSAEAASGFPCVPQTAEECFAQDGMGVGLGVLGGWKEEVGRGALPSRQRCGDAQSYWVKTGTSISIAPKVPLE